MARQRVREFYDRAGINGFPLGDFLTQRLNTRSHAGERRVDGLLVPVLNFLLDFPERTRHDLPLEVPLAADELGSGRAFTRYELVEIVAPTLHFAVGQIAALLTLTGEATLLLLTRLPPRVVSRKNCLSSSGVMPSRFSCHHHFVVNHASAHGSRNPQVIPNASCRPMVSICHKLRTWCGNPTAGRCDRSGHIDPYGQQSRIGAREL